AGEAAREAAEYIAELAVAKGSKLVGKKVRELYGEADKAEVTILGLVRGGKRLFGPAREAKLKEGDALVLEAAPDALDEFRAALSLHFSEAKRKAMIKAEAEGMAVIEVVVPDGARIAGKSCESLGLAWRHRTVVIGISRGGERITKRVRKTVVRPGDILLLLAPEDHADDVVAWLGALPLADRGLVVTDQSKTWLAIGLFAAAVAAASFGLIYLPVALGIVVVGYALTRILPLSELYDHIEWPVVVLLGSMIPLGAALETSGGTELLAGGLVSLTEGWPAWAILTVLMVVTMTLSDVLNNTATAIVAAPIGIEMASRLGVSPDPFLMAVAVAASCAFLTPIGHKNNTLILGPGGYGFGDYWRMGLPLEIIVVAVSIPAILVFWPL
ncbi:MAG: SLC13 family permease, partial [Paracoccaceae bacterium]|nr:SLC13 family permease [Paracoccaceae bacterium]